MLSIRCSNCGKPYPPEGAPDRCVICTGIYDLTELPLIEPSSWKDTAKGIWNYLQVEAFGEAPATMTLGEGLTPLVWGSIESEDGKTSEVGFKCEFLNPTGSFKDRGSAACVQFLISRGIQTVYEDSSGNAGASLAAYAARAGMEAHLYVPASASGVKMEQMKTVDAVVHPIEGSRSAVTEALRRDLKAKTAPTACYASHASMPFNLAGYATLAIELFEQIGRAPGSLVLPAGQGGLLLGVALGFEWLVARGKIERLPQIYGVQARACAPLWAVHSYGAAGLAWVSEGETMAEGIRIKYPLRGDAVLQTVERSGGSFFAVDEEEILEEMKTAARMGLMIEATSAVVFPVLTKHVHVMKQPVVAILTGSGYKSLEKYEAISPD
ncbi:MAG: pyridoxal-5'-phosphate-dependent protein subunit beta [Anaerolineae bacterium]|jgi:threonine synthase|nr:MAG: pyridoxal-5'-phosphate-dependent protein subunit beta [Anaerolineae bacterium]